ncbi:MAG: hypothetical protein ABSH22_19445 [Tepidisphaeraceae bacterium]|jgi:hypothetical protein
MTLPAGESAPKEADDTPGPGQAVAPIAQPPVKPRPRMLAFLIVVFVLWIALLLVLYFTTVYPMRHPAGG